MKISGDSDVTAKGISGSLGASGTFTISPKQDKSVEIISGTDENNAVTIQGSPFSEETDLKALNVGSKKYFHSKTHTHVADSAWLKDSTNHWHECIANDGEKMDLSSHMFDDWIIDTPATETVKGSKHRNCTICGQKETVEVIAEKPVITIGAGSIHQISSGKNMILTCSGKLEDLTGVYVDDKLVDKSNYTLKSGSTILTLKESYLDTLSAGKHTLKFQYKDNISAETDFTITAKVDVTPVKPNFPKTDDVSNTILYFGLTVLFGFIARIVLKKKENR